MNKLRAQFVAGFALCIIATVSVGESFAALAVVDVGFGMVRLNSNTSSESHDLRSLTCDVVELLPIVPASSSAGDPLADEIEILSAPQPGAASLPALATTSVSGTGGCALLVNSLEVVPALLHMPLVCLGNAVLPMKPPFRFFRPPRNT